MSGVGKSDIIPPLVINGKIESKVSAKSYIKEVIDKQKPTVYESELNKKPRTNESKEFDNSISFNTESFTPERKSLCEKSYVSQRTKLESWEGDCGPAAGSALLKICNFFKDKSSMDSIKIFREFAGMRTSIGGHWAMSEDKIKKGITEISKGAIRPAGDLVIDKHGKPTLEDAKKVINFIKKALNQGKELIFESGYIGKSRHYMTVAGIENGKIILLDSYSKTSKFRELDPKQLLDYMNNVSTATVIMSFQKH